MIHPDVPPAKHVGTDRGGRKHSDSRKRMTGKTANWRRHDGKELISDESHLPVDALPAKTVRRYR
jgi:hypothetical protein